MISDDLRKLSDLVPKNSIIVLHVRLNGVYDSTKSYSYQAQQLLDEIRHNISPREIYIPTFTYNFSKSKVFDVRETPSETGRFSEEIRIKYLFNKRRYLDPMFSVIETENQIQDTNIITKAYGNESIWYYLDNKEHYILNINLHEEIISTQLHYLEFIHSVPYRYKKFFNGYLVDWDGKKKDIYYESYVRYLNKGYDLNRVKIANIAELEKSLFKIGLIRTFDWSILKRALIKELSKDINYLIN